MIQMERIRNVCIDVYIVWTLCEYNFIHVFIIQLFLKINLAGFFSLLIFFLMQTMNCFIYSIRKDYLYWKENALI